MFKTRSGSETDDITKDEDRGLYKADSIHICAHKIAQPTVLFRYSREPTVNMTAEKPERAGAKVITKVFKNLDAADIRDSVDAFERSTDQAQIIMFRADFQQVMNWTVPQNSLQLHSRMQRSKMGYETGKRDGLALGICNGFQALVSWGLYQTVRSPDRLQIHRP
ncbi:MAG: phosphoribosylformylglycinamidine synthase subunit PurQ [Blautia marasmi]